MKLLTPVTVGDLSLPNRVLMAPLTRVRADRQHVATDLIAEHYRQRASAGLLIAEATMVAADARAFGWEPGIYGAAHVEGWRKVTTAVHAAGGRIALQLWHPGRASHHDLNNGVQPVSSSNKAIRDDTIHTPKGKVAYAVPRALRDDELPGIVAGFRQAAVNARAAGFDGVEVHGANGYLLDEFLRDGANQRSGPYGGARENRARLLFEVLEATCEVWGSDRVGLRLSPLNSFNSMRDSDPVGLTAWLAGELNRFKLAYLHLMRGDFKGLQQGDLMTPARAAYQGVLIGNMGYSGEEAAQAVAAGQLDAVAFGVPFLANPDLPERLRSGAPLNAADPKTFYTEGPAGYTDYPRWQAQQAA